MYPADLFFRAFLGFSIVLTADPIFAWSSRKPARDVNFPSSPPHLGDIMAAPPNFTNPVEEALKARYNITVVAGNAPQRPINLTTTPVDDTRREPIVPPLVDVTKRLAREDDYRCVDIRQVYFVESDEPILYHHSTCRNPNNMHVICIYFGRFGQQYYGLVRRACPDGTYCVQQSDGRDFHASCIPGAYLVVWAQHDGTQGRRQITSASSRTQNLRVISQYWDMSRSGKKFASNTTYVSTSAAHTRFEFHNLEYATSPAVAIPPNQGFDIYVTPYGVRHSTLIISWLAEA